MKKQVAKFILDHGAEPAYSGKTKTMVIKIGSRRKPSGYMIELAILAEFGYGLPFKLVSQEKPFSRF